MLYKPTIRKRCTILRINHQARINLKIMQLRTVEDSYALILKSYSNI